MNLDAKIIKLKLELLELSCQLGSVTQACKVATPETVFTVSKSFMKKEVSLRFAILSA